MGFMSSLSGKKKGKTEPDISVCIATFRRPQGLARLLDSIQGVAASNEFRLEIIIVDNDGAGTARPVAESMCRKFDCLRYFVEPQQNISHARNRAVQEARGTWIAFIDDDETAGTNWLEAYWQMVTERPGDGYFGPVLPRFEHPVPAWMDKDVFFGRRRYATGTRLPHGGKMITGNAFVRRSLFSEHKFDPCYGLTGGGDSELFNRMVNAGASFYWCDSAITCEYYPPERACLRWIVLRAFRGGFTHTLIKRKRQPRFYQQVAGVMKAMCGTVVFGLMLPFEIVRGRKYAAWRLVRLSVQLGHICAFLNVRYEEYKVKDTRESFPR